MGTPTFINFSRVTGPVIDTILRIDDGLCDAWSCSLEQFAYLRVSDDPYDGGYELAGELSPCSGESALAEIAAAGREFGLAYICRDTRATFAVYFTEIDVGMHTVTVSVESSYVYHRDDEHPQPGRWFEGWLVSLAVAVQADVCSYGNRELIDNAMEFSEVLARLRRPRYEALDPVEVLRRLRSGEILQLPDPVFHSISVDLIGVPEVRAIMNDVGGAPSLEYKLAPGYHVLSNIA